MKTKTLFWLIAVLTFLSASCDKNSTTGNNSRLPELEETDDVCTKMDDLNFMAYCYENFDVNGDSKVSMSEAAAAKFIGDDSYQSGPETNSLKGVEYFSNITSIFIRSGTIDSGDFRYNNSLEFISLPYCKSIILASGITDISIERSYQCELIDASRCKLLENIKVVNIPIVNELLLGTSNPPSLWGCYGKVLKVPAESIEAYKNSDWAEHFETIEAL